MSLIGIILKGVGGRYSVSVSDKILSCSLDGKLRLGKEVPVPGDIVEVGNTRGSYHICKIFPRKNSLIRPAVANIDRLFVVASKVISTLVITCLVYILKLDLRLLE